MLSQAGLWGGSGNVERGHAPMHLRSRFAQTFRRVIRLLERALTARGVVKELSATEPLLVSAVKLPECAYLVARVPTAYLAELPRRQKEVLAMILRELGRKGIASELHISEKTVDVHIKRLLHSCAASTLDRLIKRLGMLAMLDDFVENLAKGGEPLQNNSGPSQN